jgi:putative redox protein
MQPVKVSSTTLRFQQEIAIADFHLLADEPLALGGDNTGPAPFDFVLAGLGSCKAITVKMYAERKGWALSHISVELVYQKVQDRSQILVQMQLEGELTTEQRQRLLEIADKCPVHKLLAGDVRIQTSLV